MQNGENIQALHKNLELIRFVSVALLLVHFYAACFPAFTSWGLTSTFATKVLFRLSNALFLLRGITAPKLTVLVLLAISQFGEQGKKDTDLTMQPILTWIAFGLLLYFSSTFLLDASFSETTIAVLYITSTSTGYLCVLFGGARLSRLIHVKLERTRSTCSKKLFRRRKGIWKMNFPSIFPLNIISKGKSEKAGSTSLTLFVPCSCSGPPAAVRASSASAT